jgi:hypothetical protein
MDMVRKLLSINLFLIAALIFVCVPAAPSSPGQGYPERGGSPREPSDKRLTGLKFDGTGYAIYDDWRTQVTVSPETWRPGSAVRVASSLTVTAAHLAGLEAAGIKAEAFLLLITSERTFDAEGHLRLASDERMSTLLTPSGLAIEGGIQGAVTNRFGYDWRTPLDVYLIRALSQSRDAGKERKVFFTATAQLPQSFPPGIYRVRLDYGVRAKNRNYSLSGEGFATRPFFKGRPTESHIFSPPIPASGRHVSGTLIDSSHIRPRIPWVLLADYNSNGYRGVVADEDRSHFALSNRNIIHDDVVIPLYDDAGRQISYSLEPQFPADTIEARNNIPWEHTQGELTVEVISPNGTVTSLGTAPFLGKKGNWPTTQRTEFTAWKPPMYGLYTVKATGWISDIWGNRYEGGGTYHFWVAKRLTMATATFQGVPYPVGAKYGRDIGFAPAVPADVEITATLFRNSDPDNTVTVVSAGKATSGGLFGSSQGAKQLLLDSPGEYFARILATYKDPDGHLWVCTMRHAGVVYPADSPIVAKGKKLLIGSRYVDRGETHFEGYSVPGTDVSYLAHITFPYQAGDVILIASEQQGCNKIEPVLIWEDRTRPAPYDPKVQGVGATNLKIRTANGYSPHLFPEYITEWAYYYGAAPRPGFMSRFLVAENGARAPYWPTSPNSFGGQIGTSANGDLPGDIYRLLGGVVMRKKDQAPAYAGYMSSAFLLPEGTNNNRVIAPGEEDVIGSNGEKARFYLVSTRPGSVYETGAGFIPVAQIDPMLPVSVVFTLTYPDGRVKVAEGTGDVFGSFAGTERWTLDIPGVYRYFIEGTWQGHKGYMPGLPPGGGIFYVVEKDRPAGPQTLNVSLPAQTTFNPGQPFTINGSSTAPMVHYAAVIPGAVIDQGELAVVGGKFRYVFDPVAIHAKTPTYDIVNLINGKPEIGKIVHLTFFARERPAQETSYHAFRRIIFRGTRVLLVK